MQTTKQTATANRNARRAAKATAKKSGTSKKSAARATKPEQATQKHDPLKSGQPLTASEKRARQLAGQPTTQREAAAAVEVPKVLVDAQKRAAKWAVSKFANVTKPAVVALFALISKATKRKPMAAKEMTDNQRAQASWLFAAGVVEREQTEAGMVYFAK